MNFIMKGNIYEPVSKLEILEINTNNYIGHAYSARGLVKDIIFTKTFLQNMQGAGFSEAFWKLLLELSANEIKPNRKLRKEGEMKSVLLPESGKRKVVEFCSLSLTDVHHEAYILVELGDNDDWNKHGKSRSWRNDFHRKAQNRQQYYRDTYCAGRMLLDS